MKKICLLRSPHGGNDSDHSCLLKKSSHNRKYIFTKYSTVALVLKKKLTKDKYAECSTVNSCGILFLFLCTTCMCLDFVVNQPEVGYYTSCPPCVWLLSINGPSSFVTAASDCRFVRFNEIC
jgi:hypothetical protein